MLITKAKQKRNERKSFVASMYNEAYENKYVLQFVKETAKKFKCTEQTIWNDLKPIINERRNKELKEQAV